MSTAADSLSAHRIHPGTHPFAPLLARLRARSLDRWLMHGIEPWRTPVLAARARQLTGERNRRSLARRLERLGEPAEKPPRHVLRATARPSGPNLGAAQPLLVKLAARLRASEPVDPRGVAALSHLLADGNRPIRRGGDLEAFARALQRIEWWLDARR